MRSKIVTATFIEHSLVVQPEVKMKLRSFKSNCLHLLAKELVLDALVKLDDRVSHLDSMPSYLKLTKIKVEYRGNNGKIESFCFKHKRRIHI